MQEVDKEVRVYDCGFKSTDTDPCKDCPRLMSAMYRCGLLQEVNFSDDSEHEDFGV